MILKINCNRCNGPMWEEDIPDSSTVIDIVCMYCGDRKFVNKKKWMNLKNRIEKNIAKRHATEKRVLSSQG